MTIIDVVWFRSYKFQNAASENANAFRFSDFRVQIVPLFYSEGKQEFFKKSCFVRSWVIFSGNISRVW